jgi:2-dehydropantoate 2-reductase
MQQTEEGRGDHEVPLLAVGVPYASRPQIETTPTTSGGVFVTKIAVLGSGANGTSIGADLTHAGLDVVLIDQWPENVQAMRDRGARVEMPQRTLEVPVRAYHLCDVCTFVDRFDVVLVLVKAYDTRWACQLIEPYLKPDSLVAGVQNGMTTDIIAEVVGPARTIGCVIEITSAMFEPGVVVRDSPPDRSWFATGSIDPSTHGRESVIADLLRHSGVVEVVEDILAAKWMKLVSNSTTLTSTALLGLPLHEAVSLPGMRDVMIRSGQEALDVGTALGHPTLPIFGLSRDEAARSNRLVETLLDKILYNFTLPNSKTTVLQDWMKGRRSETQDINGLVVSVSTRLGRKATVNDAIVKLAARIEAGTLKPDPANLGLLLGSFEN